MRSLLLILLPVVACAEKSEDTAEVGADGGDGGGDGAEGLSLNGCETSIDAELPSFYQSFFACQELALDGDMVQFVTDSLPPHESYYYGEGHELYAEFDTSGGRFANPNSISEQSLLMRIPLEPTALGIEVTAAMVDGEAGDPDEYHPSRGGTPGVALNGVALFHGVAAPNDQLAEEEYTFDSYEGHPQNDGLYHYHGPSPGPLEVLQARGLVSTTTPGAAGMELYGVMCDGTVVMGCVELDGGAVETSGLDAQGGHVGDLVGPDGTVYLEGRYHTHVCRTLSGMGTYAPEVQYYESCGS
jgi:hypothetical protein